jgi:hypothetical protein
MKIAMLTTTDNPFDPFDNYDEWFAYDTRMGHHTLSFLARVAFTSDESSEVDQSAAIEDAIDEIVKENVSGLYKKVIRERNEI